MGERPDQFGAVLRLRERFDQGPHNGSRNIAAWVIPGASDGRTRLPVTDCDSAMFAALQRPGAWLGPVERCNRSAGLLGF